MHEATLTILLALTAARVWRFVALDLLTETIRFRLAPEGTRRNGFLNCPWCAGTHATAGLWLLVWSQVPLAAPGLVLGAATCLTGFIGTVDRKLTEWQ